MVRGKPATYDIVLLDISMPVMDGHFLSRLKEREKMTLQRRLAPPNLAGKKTTRRKSNQSKHPN